LVGGVLGGVLGAAAARPPQDIPPCAAYQAIVNEDVAAGVRRALYLQDVGRLNACLQRQ
jgi:hypothetical protein